MYEFVIHLHAVPAPHDRRVGHPAHAYGKFSTSMYEFVTHHMYEFVPHHMYAFVSHSHAIPALHYN